MQLRGTELKPLPAAEAGLERRQVAGWLRGGRPCSIGPSVATTCARGEGASAPRGWDRDQALRSHAARARCWLAVFGDIGVTPGRCAGCQAWHGPRGPEGEVRVGSSAAWGLIRSRLTSNGAAAAAAFGSVPLTHTTATSLPSRPPSCFHGGSRSPAALAEGS